MMEGCERWELGEGSALGLGDWFPPGLSSAVLRGSDDGRCFVIMIQNYFLTDSPDLPVMCLFFFPVLQLQCRTGVQDLLVLWSCLGAVMGELICWFREACTFVGD